MKKIYASIAIFVLFFSSAFCEIRLEIIKPSGGTIISQDAKNEFIEFKYSYFSDSNEAQDISANFGYHYAEGYFLEDLIQENLDLKQACNADENNSAGWQNCKMAFDSLQIISKPVFLDLQIKNNLEEKNASTAEIAINNIYPKIIEFLPAGKTNTNEIYFKIQSENFDVDIPSIKVIVNDTIE